MPIVAKVWGENGEHNLRKYFRNTFPKNYIWKKVIKKIQRYAKIVNINQKTPKCLEKL